MRRSSRVAEALTKGERLPAMDLGFPIAYPVSYIKDFNDVVHLVVVAPGDRTMVVRLHISKLAGMIAAARLRHIELGPDQDAHPNAVVDLIERDLVPSRWMRVTKPRKPRRDRQRL